MTTVDFPAFDRINSTEAVNGGLVAAPWRWKAGCGSLGLSLFSFRTKFLLLF